MSQDPSINAGFEMTTPEEANSCEYDGGMMFYQKMIL